MPDPSGATLPRRALLLATAVPECDEVPEKPLSNTLSQLLETYGRRIAPVLQDRILGIYTLLPDGKAKNIAESIICNVLHNDEFNLRWAAADLLLETGWHSAAIVQALLHAWQTYPAPAGALANALQDLHRAHPEYFERNTSLTFPAGYWKKTNPLRPHPRR
jgi:hypothetical protein